MSLKDVLPAAPYNKKVVERFEKPRNCGTLEPKTTLTLTIGKSEKHEEGVVIALYLLVDQEDGIIADAKFQAIAPPLLIAACDVVCEVILRKNYELARMVSPEAILKKLDDSTIDLKVVLDALVLACRECDRLGLPKTPLKQEEGKKGEPHPDWQRLTQKEKISLIEAVIEEDVRPYIELDEGGIEVLDLINDRELIIAYKGACTTCFSSIGATLSSIQQILQSKIHPDLVVVPNMDNIIVNSVEN